MTTVGLSILTAMSVVVIAYAVVKWWGNRRGLDK